MIEKINELDRQIFLLLNFDGGPAMDTAFWLITGKLLWIPLYMLILWLIYRKHGLRNTIVAIICIIAIVGVSDQICNFFKNNLPKHRPTYTPELEGMVHTLRNYYGARFGTVSAHAAISFGIATFSSILLRSRLFTILIVFWALLVSYSRIFAGLHFPLDLFWGMLTGITVALIMFWIYRKVICMMDKRKTITQTPA